MTEDEIRDWYRDVKDGEFDPDRLALEEAFAIAVRRGMKPETAAAFLGVRLNSN